MRSIVIAAAFALGAAPLSAQGWIEPDRSTRDWGVVRIRTAVSVRITGRIAQIDVEEWFENRGPRLGEGDYLYPLPGEAVFSNFSLFQGDQELTGETMDAAAARQIYEAIVRRKKDPALIELAGHGLLRARVFPINAGETRKITLRYTQVLARAGDALQFRYLAGSRHAGDPRSPTVVHQGDVHGRPRVSEGPVAFTLTVDDAQAFDEPFSPTHELRVTRRDGRLTVRSAESLQGDLSLFLPFARETVGLTLATHRADGEAGYFMLTVSPGRAEVRGAPRDLTVVVDVSGSMSGSKLQQAQAALHQLLGTLRPADRFRLVSFSNLVRADAPGWTAATPDNLTHARTWVDRLSANGGTNISGALDEGFRLSSPEERLPIVIFLTDGLPSVGERDPERIANAAATRAGRARVFAFGVGHDVNTYLLDRLSAAGRGATQYVAPGEDVEAALGTLAAKIQHPVLTDLSLEAPVRITEIYPGQLPDLFHGEELVIFGRYEPARGRGGRVAVVGRRHNRTERFQTDAAFPAHETANEFIPRLWAARKLGALQQAIRLEGSTPELIEEVRRTALRYGLLSEYTSYLVQEPGVVANLPAGLPTPATPMAAQDAARTTSAAQGAGAVAQAKADRQRREASRFTDIAEAEEALRGRAHGPDARAVAGRWFIQRDGVWTDLRRPDSVRTIVIEPFSEAYFTLLRHLPELAPYVSAFDAVQVTGERLSLRFAAGGRSSVRDADAVVRAFRGP